MSDTSETYYKLNHQKLKNLWLKKLNSIGQMNETWLAPKIVGNQFQKLIKLKLNVFFHNHKYHFSWLIVSVHTMMQWAKQDRIGNDIEGS